MKVQLRSIEQMPRQVPIWHLLMEDLCQPPPERVARALGVSLRTVQRYNATGRAPRAACLAVYWLTSWGRSAVHAQAHNDAQLMAGLARAMEAEIAALRSQVQQLVRLGNFGSANDPATDLPRSRGPHALR